MADYATLLRDHVTLTCRSVDRIFLQAYLPKLQSVGGVCQFLYWQKGFGIPSSAAFGKIGDAYVAEIHRWAKLNAIPVRCFAKGENKEQIARPLLQAAVREGGDGKVVLVGIAQEKTPVWRSWKARAKSMWRIRMEWGRQMAFVNHFYFYLWDPEWGAAFWKTNAYAPWPVWIWLNGRSWAQRQCQRLGIGYAALDNGFRRCDDPEALQRIRDRLGPGAVKSVFWRWQRRLPSPRARDDLRAGYVYELAFRQFEISDTRAFDRPAAGPLILRTADPRPPRRGPTGEGRADLRPADQLSHAGTFRTQVITKDVDPQISCYYRASRIKQYFNCDARSHAVSSYADWGFSRC